MKIIRNIISLFLIILISVIPVTSKGAVNKRVDINNVEDVNEFTDNYFKDKMKKYNVPGACIVIVKDNKEILKKAYGYSDVSKKIEVDANETTFPACSVSKLFTAAAIMQLRDEGKINLDEDVNEYIKPYKIKNKYNKKVTVRNLLTHTGGFDECSELNSKTADKDNIQTQEYYMNLHEPIVSTEPGTISRYSNEGYNLLGYIIQKVSGITYEEYIKRNILEPLKMNKSSVRLYDNHIAKGYTDNEESPLLYQYTSGSSGIIAPVYDMENFIIACLNDGRFDDKSIFKAGTINEMQKKQFANSSIMAGMGLGFIRSVRNNQNIVKHEGALPGYTTTLFLMPDENLGIYIATNTLGALPFNFENEFLDNFYPYGNSEFAEIYKKNKYKTKDYSAYEGSYRGYDGISKNTVMKIFGFDEDMKIKDNEDGTLTLNECTTEKEYITTKLIEKEDGVFVRQDGRGYFTFRIDNGKVIYAFNDISHNAFERIRFYETKTSICTIFIVVLLLFIFNLLFNIVTALRNRKKAIDRRIKIIRLTNMLFEILSITGFIGAAIITAVLSLNNDAVSIIYLYICLAIVIAGVGCLIYSMVKYIKEHKNINIKRAGKIYFLVLYGVSIIFCFYLNYFNYIGFKIS